MAAKHRIVSLSCLCDSFGIGDYQSRSHPNGVYVVQWKTVSAVDGDPGAFVITMNTGAVVTPTPVATSSTGKTTTPTLRQRAHVVLRYGFP